MTRIYAAIALLSLLLVSACGGANAGGSKGGARAFPVVVEEIRGEKVEYSVSAVGAIEARHEVLVSSRVSGVLEAIHFIEGTRVTTETVLAEIEPERFKLQKDAAEAAYKRAQAESKEAEAGLKRRESGTPGEGDRPAGIFSKEEVEAWRTRVSVAKSNEAERKAEFDRAELDYRNAFVRSPVAGVIEEKSVQLGQWVQPGVRFARIVKTDELLLRFSVPEDQAIALKPGMAAEFAVRGAAAKYGATLMHVKAYADETTRMVEVLAEVDKQHVEGLTPGSFARVTVPVGSNDNAATVPETALRPSEKGYLIYIVSEDNKAKETVIEIGLRTAGGRIEVTRGVKPGQKVVVQGADALRDGVDVAIVSTPTGGASP